jgi:hypothetical protein
MMIPFLLFGRTNKIPKRMAVPYAILYSCFAYAIGGIEWHFFFDWHAEFGEWQWSDVVLGSVMIIIGMALSYLGFQMWRSKWEGPARR